MTEPSLPPPSSPRPPSPRLFGPGPILLAVAAALAVGGGVALWWRAPARRPAAPLASGSLSRVAASPVAARSPAPAAAPVAPRFDIVRIAPGGHAVIAGRSAPDAVVAVLADGQSLGRTRADSSGNWLLLPDRDLPPGPASLTLSATLPGGAVLAGRAALHLTVPGVPGSPGVATPGPKPAGAPPPGGGNARPAPTSLASLGAAPAGGRAHPPSRPPHPLAPGRSPSPTAPGRALSPPAPGRAAGARLAVRPGQSLWRIARQHYGKGEDYPTIYQANRAEIANPNLIFPGQTFALPPKPRHAPQPPAR